MRMSVKTTSRAERRIKWSGWRLSANAVAAAALAIAVTPTSAAVLWTPTEFRTMSGIRPFVEAHLNGKPFLLMVHANASFYVMTTHANAASIGMADLNPTTHYGISADGHLSELGMSRAILSSLRVGDDEVKNVPLQVFETPEPTMQGMLGIKWLQARRVIVDYDTGRIGIPSSAQDTEAEDRRLLSRRYIAHRMTWDSEGNAYTVSGNVTGKPVRITVATVGESLVDTDFARVAGIALGPVVDRFGGPSGSRLCKNALEFVRIGSCSEGRLWDVSSRAKTVDNCCCCRNRSTIM